MCLILTFLVLILILWLNCTNVYEYECKCLWMGVNGSAWNSLFRWVLISVLEFGSADVNQLTVHHLVLKIIMKKTFLNEYPPSTLSGHLIWSTYSTNLLYYCILYLFLISPHCCWLYFFIWWIRYGRQKFVWRLVLTLPPLSLGSIMFIYIQYILQTLPFKRLGWSDFIYLFLI